MDSVPGIIGYVLFALSELLPLINIPTNGILQTLILGFSKSFKPPKKDIEMAQRTVVKPEYTKLINSIESNPQLHSVISKLTEDSQFFNNIFITLKNPANLEYYLENLHLINSVIKKEFVVDSLPFMNKENVSILSDFNENPQMVKLTKELIKSEHRPTIINIINVLFKNPSLIENINTLINQAVV